MEREENSRTLQQDLDALIEWGRNWAMKFAPDKGKLLSITCKTTKAIYNIRGTECMGPLWIK